MSIKCTQVCPRVPPPPQHMVQMSAIATCQKDLEGLNQRGQIAIRMTHYLGSDDLLDVTWSTRALVVAHRIS